jgi:FkbM family methyltransferase
MLGNRPLGTVAKAAFQIRHYRVLMNSFLRYERPLDGLLRYLFAAGAYPVAVPIRTPVGVVRPVIYSYHDMMTVSEIFCREDYHCGEWIRTVVDFGSNIGVSALYFLTRNRESFAYLFEPLPSNGERLLKNLHHFEGRYEFYPVAIALSDGEADFGFEETGRYGGLGLKREKTIRVPCREVSSVLRGILEKRGEIDVLKIDIESLEEEILTAIPRDLLRGIKQIFVEYNYGRNPVPLTHDYFQDWSIARFRRREASSIRSD